MRHEGVPPSNNLIKDGTHRATVFVGPTLKSFPFLFSRRFNRGLYGGEGYKHQENSQRDWNIRGCGRGIHGRRGTMMVQLKLTHPKSDKIIFVDFKKAKRGR